MTPVEKLQAIERLAGDRRLSPGALRVGVVLVNRYRPEWGYACPASRALAATVGMGKSPTLRAINQLVKLGWFTRTRPGNGRAPTRYGLGVQLVPGQGVTSDAEAEICGPPQKGPQAGVAVPSEGSSLVPSGGTANRRSGPSRGTSFKKGPMDPEMEMKGSKGTGGAPGGARSPVGPRASGGARGVRADRRPNPHEDADDAVLDRVRRAYRLETTP
jgi:hypothetical protein